MAKERMNNKKRHSEMEKEMMNNVTQHVANQIDELSHRQSDSLNQ